MTKEQFLEVRAKIIATARARSERLYDPQHYEYAERYRLQIAYESGCERAMDLMEKVLFLSSDDLSRFLRPSGEQTQLKCAVCSQKAFYHFIMQEGLSEEEAYDKVKSIDLPGLDKWYCSESCYKTEHRGE